MKVKPIRTLNQLTTIRWTDSPLIVDFQSFSQWRDLRFSTRPKCWKRGTVENSLNLCEWYMEFRTRIPSNMWQNSAYNIDGYLSLSSIHVILYCLKRIFLYPWLYSSNCCHLFFANQAEIGSWQEKRTWEAERDKISKPKRKKFKKSKRADLTTQLRDILGLDIETIGVRHWFGWMDEEEQGRDYKMGWGVRLKDTGVHK